MLLHHIAAFGLYFSYIFGNFIVFGSVVAYLHDLADIFGTLSKLLSCTVYENGAAAAFICVMIVWFVTRILSITSQLG